MLRREQIRGSDESQYFLVESLASYTDFITDWFLLNAENFGHFTSFNRVSFVSS